MGHTLPSATQLLFNQIDELEPFYYATRRGDQLILDGFFEDLLQHRAAIANSASLLPIQVMPFVILLEERKRNNIIQISFHNRIEEIEKKIFKLFPLEEGQGNEI